LLCVTLVSIVGCEVAPEPIRLDTTGVKAKLDYSDLSAVLDKSVDKNGLLVMGILEEHSQRLDRQLRGLAVTGPGSSPELFATPEDEIAYWYNARAGWSMKLALMSKTTGSARRSRLINRTFPLDGKQMSLLGIDEALREYDDWRVLVVSPGVTLSRAPLPPRAFSGKDVKRRITERLSRLVDDQRRFVIDVPSRQTRVPQVLWEYRERIIADHHRSTGATGANLTTALLPHVAGSAHRRLQDAIGYRCVLAARALHLTLGIHEEKTRP